MQNRSIYKLTFDTQLKGKETFSTHETISLHYTSKWNIVEFPKPLTPDFYLKVRGIIRTYQLPSLCLPQPDQFCALSLCSWSHLA